MTTEKLPKYITFSFLTQMLAC